MRKTALLFASATLLVVSQLGAQALTATDRLFVEEAAKGNTAEIKMAQLALQKTSNPKIKEFANMMITDHSKANAELKPIAEAQKVPWPADLTGESALMYTQLSALSGTSFDKQYVAGMVKDHQKDLNEYQKEEGVVKDAKLKTYVNAVEPVVARHLEHAKALKTG